MIQLIKTEIVGTSKAETFITQKTKFHKYKSKVKVSLLKLWSV